MALFHFTVTQTKRSKGQSAIASAAYRSGEKLYSEYYGEYSDYTRKGGVICSDILLPSHAPPEYADRQTLWNAVEKAERGKNAQLAYSFEISLQNEFSLEENIALAREFLFREFVSRGMTVDVSFHEKECEDGGTPNPHFHFLCPIRPMEQDGTWGIKQRREYVLDEEGNRIRDANGKYVFNAVPTTDWGSPETLEHWREAWAEMCNAKFAEKGLDVRIDHRSYERQGVDLLPTIHEGATVRAMEKKGIRTEKGEFNRWIKATNAVIKDIRKKISLLFDWITEIKAELAKPQTPDLVSLLNDYYTQRKAGAYSQKGKISNLKEMNETYNYLRANGIYTLEDYLNREPALDHAVEFLLNHWIIRKPIGPCHYGIGTLFMQVEYPFRNYNLFQYVYVLSFYDKAKNDYRFLEALDILKSKTQDGQIVVERVVPKLGKLSFCKKGKPSISATKRYNEILQNLG